MICPFAPANWAGKAYQRWISIETPNSKWANFPAWRFDPKAKRIVLLAYGGKGMGKCVAAVETHGLANDALGGIASADQNK
ncbi:hypothetical protein D791_00542 [Nitrincola nitratireducens]|uniref:Uncharacterized protein n=2 Tax=Nitrincola nitratireducens TaxID=1229521 RepID=W9V896_9GAMM|nr:hypothetical protein D791_00542 [Nitrincola nitratireducens]